MNRSLTFETITDESNLTVLYARLSKDDGKSGDSDSILNQRLLLENFAWEQKMSPCIFLADDGISGTTFNRPAFQKAIQLVNQGRVKNFIVKDLSRFGRDYLKVGAFTEVAFPEKEVRFIAINDNVDSEREDDNSLAPFRNLFNEWYARDCSKKIKAVKYAKGNSGVPMTANVIYGYLKGPDYAQTHEWLVDEAAAEVIRRIFHAYASGKSMTNIAEELASEKIRTPAAHKLSLGIKPNKLPSSPYAWNSQIVRQVLGYREYCGHTVNFKTTKKSYKSKKYLQNPLSEQKIFKHTHEAIIDEELFELVQEKRGTYRPRVTKTKSVGLFSGLAYCKDCGCIHRYQATGKRNSAFYYCAGNKRRLKVCETSHNIQEKSLGERVLRDIQRLMSKLETNEAELVRYLEKRNQITTSQLLENDRQKLQKAEQREAELDVILQHLYEDNLSGKVSDARYAKMSVQYEAEQAALMETLAMLQESQLRAEATNAGIVSFIKVAKQYLKPTDLQPDMVRALIEKIEIGEKIKNEGEVTQDINIIYRFVGNLAEEEVGC